MAFINLFSDVGTESARTKQGPPLGRSGISAIMLADILGWAEVGSIVFASIAAKYVYFSLYLGVTEGSEPYLAVGIACAVLFQQVRRQRGLLDAAVLQHGLRHWQPVIGALVLAFLILIAAAYVLKVSAVISRGWLIIWLAMSCSLVLCGRAIIGRLVQSMSNSGHFLRRVAIVSVGGSAQNLQRAIERDPNTRFYGLFEIDLVGTMGRGIDPTVSPKSLADLVEAGRQHEFDELVIRVGDLTADNLAIIINEVSVLPVDIWLSTTDEPLHLPIYGVERVGGINLLKVCVIPIGGWGLVIKQGIDYVLAGIGLLAALPVFLLIAVAIKLDSPGPVLFRQKRHGCNERQIEVLKFRTMTVEEDGATVQQARRDDPRVTRVGRLLRRTSLDELPQLANVLRGEMSLVGPRPHALVHNEYYRSRVSSYSNRHKVKPGITGLAQINGLRGETDTPDKMRKRVEMDIRYIDNWSIWLDLKILVLTPIYGLMNRNAF